MSSSPDRPISRSSSYENKLTSDEKKSALSSTSEVVPPLGAPVVHEPGLLKRLRRPALDLDSIATQPSVFDDPTSLELYRPPASYENTHRFDPKARWTWREEKRVLRKIDTRILIWITMMFFCLQLDRANLVQAIADDFLIDLHMTTDDYNVGNSLFMTCFLIAELPSQMIAKRIGTDVWMPCQMILWSFVSASQFWLKGRKTFLATRCLIGLLQGGFVPDCVLYLSYYYTTSELPVRFAIFWMSNYLADIVGAFLATGILRLRGVDGHAGWQYLFLIEGLLTFVIGVLSLGMMPAGPTQTKRWWLPKGWFNEREETIMVNRVLRDDPTKSDMHNRQGLSLRMIWGALKDWHLWPLYAIGLVFLIPIGPPAAYLTVILRDDLGFTTTQTNLLTLPTMFLGIIMLVLISIYSEFINSRTFSTIIMPLWELPLLIALSGFTLETSPWVYFTVVTLLVGSPYVHPIQVGWVSRNSQSVRTRTVSASVYNIFAQLGGIISAYVYRTSDLPLLRRGNHALIGVASMNIVLYLLTYVFYRTINSHRDKIWNAMSEAEREEYIRTTKDEGNARLDFRFAY